MIRKQTLILLGILAVLVGLTFYLRENPLAPSGAEITPSATSQPALLSGWQTSEITWMEWQDAQSGTEMRLEQDAQGNWVQVSEGKPVSLGKVEQIRTQVLDTRVTASLSGSYSLDALNLTQPAYVLTLGSAEGKTSKITIGKTTPTGNGYYIQVDQQAPVVAAKMAVEAILEQFKPEQLFDYTPTPEGTAAPETPASTGTPNNEGAVMPVVTATPVASATPKP